MKKILAILGFFTVSSALAATSVDETFTTTFSDYDQWDQIVSCQPGFRGSFPSPDILFLRSHVIGAGFTISNHFRADSYIGLDKEKAPTGKKTTIQRPFEDGCKPALEQLKAAVAGKEVIEVIVNRRVTNFPITEGRAHRKVNGDVLKVEYVTVEQNYEHIQFDLGGFQFSTGHILNGKTKSVL